jgi:hypothetical protein
MASQRYPAIKKFGEHHKIGAQACRFGTGLAQPGAIARNVANRAIDLRKANCKTVRGVHVACLLEFRQHSVMRGRTDPKAAASILIHDPRTIFG